MLFLNLKIQNPWSNRFESLYDKSGLTPIKNKAWEIQVMKTVDVFCFSFQATHNQDHAGINLELGLFGFNVDFNIYDTRHWNYDKNRWYEYNEEQGWH